jgi:hypothetical protein
MLCVKLFATMSSAGSGEFEASGMSAVSTLQGNACVQQHLQLMKR